MLLLLDAPWNIDVVVHDPVCDLWCEVEDGVFVRLDRLGGVNHKHQGGILDLAPAPCLTESLAAGLGAVLALAADTPGITQTRVTILLWCRNKLDIAFSAQNIGFVWAQKYGAMLRWTNRKKHFGCYSPPEEMSRGDNDDNNMVTASGQSKIFANTFCSCLCPWMDWPRYAGSIQFHAEYHTTRRPCASGPSGWKYWIFWSDLDLILSTDGVTHLKSPGQSWSGSSDSWSHSQPGGSGRLHWHSSHLSKILSFSSLS